jgi:hypothetical protein
MKNRKGNWTQFRAPDRASESAPTGVPQTNQRPEAQVCVEDAIGEDEMPLVTVVITLLVVGVLLWLVNRYIPMQSQIKSILNGVVVVVVVLWLLRAFGLLDYLLQFRVGH